MASLSEEDLCCPVCQDIYRDPVVLRCSHSFCRACLESWLTTSEMQQCPKCKRRISKDPPPDMELRTVCEAFLQKQESASVCQLHHKEFKLFCVEHQQPLCIVCEQHHSGDTIMPIEEAAADFKRQLQETLLPLRNKKQNLNKCKEQFSAAVSHVKAQARLTEKQIKNQFKKMHQFLEEEEDVRIRALREEEEQKKKSLEDKISAMSREMEILSETIRVSEEQLGAPDHSFLLQYKAAVDRVQHCPLVGGAQLGPGALIDQAKHLGNLGFNIWRNMKDLFQFYPVVLDPNTAHSDLTVSENLATVGFEEKLRLPENPERIQHLSALGSEGFTSGTHSWEVEVCGDDMWSIGVMQKSVQRKGSTTPLRFWLIYHCNGKHFAFLSPDVLKPLFQKNLQRVRVELDFNKGILSFSDANTNTPLHTFRHAFSERLFPYFQNFNTVPLQILPQSVSLTMK